MTQSAEASNCPGGGGNSQGQESLPRLKSFELLISQVEQAQAEILCKIRHEIRHPRTNVKLLLASDSLNNRNMES